MSPPRQTRQREAIARVLTAAARPLRPYEIRELAQAGGENLGMATVYRELKVLVERRELSVVELPGHSSTYYEKAGEGSRCYSFCRTCERVFSTPWENHAQPLDKILPAGFQMAGLKVESSLVVLYGRCREC